MSTKRQRTSAPLHSKVEGKEEPQAKRVKKEEKDAPAQIQRSEGPMLGGLPLYGEVLPQGGYAAVPTLARGACSSLRQVMEKVRDLKAAGKVSSPVHVLVLFQGAWLVINDY